MSESREHVQKASELLKEALLAAQKEQEVLKGRLEELKGETKKLKKILEGFGEKE